MPTTIDPYKYLSANPDLVTYYDQNKATLGSNIGDWATKHYNTYGVTENRDTGATSTYNLDPYKYLSANKDVANYYNTNYKDLGWSPEQYANYHYLTYGQAENRPTGITTTGTTGVTTEPPKTTSGFQPYSFLQASDVSKRAEYTPQPITTFVPKESTVQWQLDQLLNKDSDYIKLARSNAMEQANKAGMLGSTMAAGAGQRAAIQEALNVAKPDALTYGTSALEGQRDYYTTEQNKQKYALESLLNQEKAGYDYDKALMDAQSRIDVQKLSADTQARSDYSTQIMTSLNNLNKDIANIQMNTTLSPEDKARVIADLNANFNTSTRNMAAALGFTEVGSTWSGGSKTGYSYTPVGTSTTSNTATATNTAPSGNTPQITNSGDVIINGVTYRKRYLNNLPSMGTYFIDDSGNRYTFDGSSMIPIESNAG